MEKLIKYFFAACVVFTLVSCSKTDFIPEADGGWSVSIQASKGGDSALTKALTESGTRISASWEQGDVVYILSKNGSQEYGQMTAQSGGTTTTLSGTITKAMSVGTSYILRYLQKGQDYLYLPSQKGTLEDIAKNHDIAEAVVTVKSIDGNNVVFEEAEAQFLSKICITKFTFSRSIESVSIFCSNLKTYVRPGYSSNYSFVEVKPDAECSTVYVAMSTLASTKAVFTFLAKASDNSYYVASKKAQLENGKNYVSNVTLQGMPEYVDLGLKANGQSVCWATRNLGAGGPGQTGNYYAWAETAPKEVYSWDTYPYGSYTYITKYDPDRPDQGAVDGLSKLLPEDDAATHELGEGWRMPSLQEFRDLINQSNTELMYAYADGRWGFVFRSLIEGYTDKFIFLPRTGYYKESTMTSSNYGYYWSNQIDQISWTSSTSANTMQLKYSYGVSAEVSRMDRPYGLTIRPVFIK